MSKRRVVMSLLCLCVVAALVAMGTDAFAGCSKPPCAAVKWYAGSCICCSTGSEVFKFTALGVPGWFVNSCTGDNCLQCHVYGTSGTGCDTTLSDTCGVEGVLFCVNHGGNASTAQGQPFTASGVISGSGSFSKCDRQGKCSGSIQVTGDLSALSDQCQNSNWSAIGFTASKFNGQCCSCDVGYNADGTCSGSQTCSGAFRCSINPVPKPGNMQPYQCCALSEIDPITGNCPTQ